MKVLADVKQFIDDRLLDTICISRSVIVFSNKDGKRYIYPTDNDTGYDVEMLVKQYGYNKTITQPDNDAVVYSVDIYTEWWK